MNDERDLQGENHNLRKRLRASEKEVKSKKKKPRSDETLASNLRGKMIIKDNTMAHALVIRLMAIGVPDEVIVAATGDTAWNISKIRRSLHKFRGLSRLTNQKEEFVSRYGF
jgi:hypothetical protein